MRRSIVVGTAALLLLTFSAPQASAQAPDPDGAYTDSLTTQRARYQRLVAEAEGLYAATDVAASADRYALAFGEVRRPASRDLYNAACSAALAGETGRAFGLLYRAIEAGWNDAAHLDTDSDLVRLRAYPDLWAKAHAAVDRSRRARYGDAYDPQVAAALAEYARQLGFEYSPPQPADGG